MLYAIIHQWYNLDKSSPSDAITYDTVCEVDSIELAKEIIQVLQSELDYARKNNLLQYGSNYDGRQESIYYIPVRTFVCTSIDDFYNNPDVRRPKWL